MFEDVDGEDLVDRLPGSAKSLFGDSHPRTHTLCQERHGVHTEIALKATQRV